ncbi:aminotransferase, class V family protein [Brugia malayi]|uniref:Selenocysteine lyase n=1 Tax=Brugia malayi TaxID=6279 RepID=A0A0I9R319_BRUMA|nr:aminotransferase, class V family protein [Brugia malayi]CTP81387.1 Bm3359 [Brugia malayi]VIO92829.1 aminotransferase, class V family protein [Brugia malayi]
MTWYIEEQEKVYLDYNATTPIDKDVKQSIVDAFNIWGNPSSNNELGKKAKDGIEEARENVARLLHVSAKEIFFTSGGTETNNWVIYNCIEHRKAVWGRDYKPHIIASAIEHPSILEPLRDLKKKQEIDLTEISIDLETGRVKLNDLEEAFCERTCLVSVMTANNETGVIQPVAEVAEIARKCENKFESRIFVHSDVSQAIGKIDVNVNALNVDFVTVTGHKFYGPRIGALVLRDESKVPLRALFLGGNQERSKRAGTENTPLIVGLGKAAQVALSGLQSYSKHMQKIRDYFEKQLKEKLNDEIMINFEASERLPNTSSVIFVKYGGNASELLSKCKSFIASTGAACHAATEQCSGVLTACGIRDELARRTVRFSFGRDSTSDEVDRVVNELKAIMFMSKYGSSLLNAINKGPISGF